MKPWIEEMLEQAKAMSESDRECPFDDEMKPGERSVGTLDPLLQGLVVLATSLQSKALEKYDAHRRLHEQRIVHNPAECIKHHEEMDELEKKTKMLMGIVWMEIRANYELSEEENLLSLRSNWQVTAGFQESSMNPLAALLGGGGASVISGADLLAAMADGDTN